MILKQKTFFLTLLTIFTIIALSGCSFSEYEKIGGKYFLNKENNKIYHRHVNLLPEYLVLENVSKKNFKVLSDNHAKSESNAFYWNIPIAKADVATFVSLSNYTSRDKNTIYFEEKALGGDGFDRKSVEYLGADNFAQNFYIKDICCVYWVYNGEASKILGLSSNEFKIINNDYGMDNSYLYSDRKKIKIADMNTLEFLNINKPSSDPLLYKDSINVYCNDFVLENADTKTFELISSGYYKDKNNVYYRCGILEGADLSSFHVISENEANQVYAKDNENVYSYGEKIKGADPVSFHVTKNGYAEDKNGTYLGKQKVK